LPKIDGVVFRKKLQLKFKQAGHPLLSRKTRKQQLILFQGGIDRDQFIVLGKSHGMSPSVFQGLQIWLRKGGGSKAPGPDAGRENSALYRILTRPLFFTKN
jgi:hypothetical protein